jgi:hypothetical protein
MRLPVTTALGDWISVLATPRQSVTVNSRTSRPGKVNVMGRLISASLTLAKPEFFTRSSTSEGSATSWWRANTFQAVPVPPRLAPLGTRLTGASICSRQAIRRHRNSEMPIQTPMTAMTAAMTTGMSLG